MLNSILLIALICWIVPTLLKSATNVNISYNGVYEVNLQSQEHPLYAWDDVSVRVVKASEHRSLLTEQSVILRMTGTPVAQLTHYKVFVSLTTISSRIYTVWQTIYSILNGVVIPTQIFLFISRESYLLDEGIQTLPNSLLSLLSMNLLRIVYTDNIGPHRKLLPLLGKYFDDNSTLIMNVDDDMAYTENSTMLYQLLTSFQKADESSVVALRVRRIGLCNGRQLRYTRYYSWNVLYATGRNEMLVMPTGTGGILYRPQFFHPIVFSEQFRHVTGTGDDLMFRLACIANKVPVVIACRDREYRGRVIRRCPIDIEGMKRAHSLRLRSGGNDKGSDDVSSTSQSFKHTLSADDRSSALTILFTQRRRLAHESLFSINRNGKNDEQFTNALAYLATAGVIPKFSSLIEQYYHERDSKCYEKDNKNQAYCSIYSCRARKVTVASVTTTTMTNATVLTTQKNESSIKPL